MSKHTTKARNAEDAELFRARFYDFMKLELASGGPDHHMTLAATLAREAHDPHFLIGMYMAPYNVPGGIALYDNLNRYSDPNTVVSFVTDNWAGLPVNRDRRPCKSRAKMAEYIVSYSRWIDTVDLTLSYDELWNSLQASVRYVGRYSGLKILEGLRRSGLTEATQHDIRAAGAWSPRLALSYLYPEWNEVLNNDGTRRAIAPVEQLAAYEFGQAAAATGVNTWYNFETLLCNSRQCADGTIYPARALDVELQRFRQVTAHFGWSSLMAKALSARQVLWDHRFLGETRDKWDGPRALERVQRDLGYTWSDALFDYTRTTDFREPVRWAS